MPPGPKPDGSSDVDSTDIKSRDANVLKSGGEFKIILLKEAQMCPPGVTAGLCWSHHAVAESICCYRGRSHGPEAKSMLPLKHPEMKVSFTQEPQSEG